MTTSLYLDRLDALPGLFAALIQAPLIPLRHGTLPEPEALYLFYRDQIPVGVGSPPHINVLGALGPSVQIGYRVERVPADPVLTELEPGHGQFSGLCARWLILPLAEERKLLELYAAEYLKLPPTHPDLAFMLIGPAVVVPAQGLTKT